MKVKFDCVEKGLVNYLDSELLSQYPSDGYQKWIIGAGISLIFKNTSNKICDFLMGPYGSMLGIVSDNGLIDIDLVKEVLKENMPQEGVRINIPMIDITLKTEDIDTLYQYILDIAKPTKEVTKKL